MLHYKEYKNSGTPIAFIHGFGADSRIWHDFIEKYGLNAITIDLPGYGKSQNMKSNSIEVMADKVHEVLQKCRFKDGFLVGHSMGGYVGLSLLEQKGTDLFKGFVMLNSHPFADNASKKLNREKQIDFINKYGVEPFTKQFIPDLFSTLKQDVFAIHSLSLRATQIPTETWIHSLQAMMNRPDRSAFIKKLDIPVLYVLGTADEVINIDEMLVHVSTHNTCQIEIMEGFGHMGMLENPSGLLKAFRKFIEYSNKVEA